MPVLNHEGPEYRRIWIEGREKVARYRFSELEKLFASDLSELSKREAASRLKLCLDKLSQDIFRWSEECLVKGNHCHRSSGCLEDLREGFARLLLLHHVVL